MPVERCARMLRQKAHRNGCRRVPVLVLPLHGHLAPAAWAAAQAAPGAQRRATCRRRAARCRARSAATSRELRERGLLCRPHHRRPRPTAASTRRSRSPAPSTHAAQRPRLGRGRSSVPARASSAPTPRSATAAWPPSTAPTPRSRSASRPCSPRASPAATRASATAGQPPHPHRPRAAARPGEVPSPPASRQPIAALDTSRARHRLREAPADLDGYAASGLPARTMGRTIDEDPLFFAAALAAGAALAHLPRVAWGGGTRAEARGTPQSHRPQAPRAGKEGPRRHDEPARPMVHRQSRTRPTTWSWPRHPAHPSPASSP